MKSETARSRRDRKSRPRAAALPCWALGRALAGALALSSLAASPAHAQTAGDPAANAANADASVGISAGGALRSTQDLEFGSIVAGPGGGTFTVRPDGTSAMTGNLVPVGENYPAAFLLERRILIEFPAGYEPDLPDSITLVHVADPSHTMTVSDLTSDFGRTILQVSLPFLPPIRVPAWLGRTEYDFRVGGTLTVPEGQAPGLYEGAFEVVVEFQ